MLKSDHEKVKLEDEPKIHYGDGPCEIYIKSVAGNIIKGPHLKRNIYLQIMLISLSDLIWRVFATIINLTNQKNKKLNFFAGTILANINCNLRLPLDQATYFNDIVIWFNCADKIVYREKNMLFCRCLYLQKQNHVVCINKSTIVIVYSSLYFVSGIFFHLSCLLKCFCC